jgi:hypothetical protein
MDVVMVKDFGPLINLAATATKLEMKPYVRLCDQSNVMKICLLVCF